MDEHMITVEIAYATPERQEILALRVAQGVCVFDAVIASGIASRFPEIEVATADMGIFGKVVKSPRECVLRAGDRVEIYRPLKIDPKQARFERARRKV